MDVHRKCPCAHCGGNIEFPPHGEGVSIVCPHCRQQTVLNSTVPRQPLSEAAVSATTEPEFPPPSPALPASRRWILALLIAFIGAGAIGWFVWQKSQPADVSSVSGATNQPAQPAVTAQSVAPKSIDDLKADQPVLERTQGSGLIYVVGTVRNESDHQRFGVKVELELLNAGGQKAGVAQDYVRVIEPRQSWRFRALVLESNATSAKVASIQEE